MTDYKAGLEPLTNWALRTRKLLQAVGKLGVNDILDPQKRQMGQCGTFRSGPLVIEFVGMGGAHKSHLIAELSSKYFNSFGLDCRVFPEPYQSITGVSRKNPRKFRAATYKVTCDRLREVLASEKDLALFDRGLLDFMLWFNLDLNDGHINEDRCRRMLQDVFDRTTGRIDILFVHTGNVDDCLKGKAVVGSLPFMDSFGLGQRSADETYARHQYFQRIYHEFFLRGRKTLSAVNLVVHVNWKRNQDFASVFRKAVAVIDLYLALKVWQSFVLSARPDVHMVRDIARDVLAYSFYSLRGRLGSLDSDLRDFLQSLPGLMVRLPSNMGDIDSKADMPCPWGIYGFFGSLKVSDCGRDCPCNVIEI